VVTDDILFFGMFGIGMDGNNYSSRPLLPTLLKCRDGRLKLDLKDIWMFNHSPDSSSCLKTIVSNSWVNKLQINCLNK
jgi:hypothetical protein